MVSSSESQVARRYADALLAACSDDEINDLSDELNSFANAVEESSDLKNVLLNPTFSAEEQQATLAAIMAHFSMSERSQNFINLLVER
ncbi:MAG: F0F1 ATP synthase subunit delta, partial [Myxococcota bacterium]